MDKTIICPGCGWMGQEAGLNHRGACPVCTYENGLEPYRLLTLAEMLDGETYDAYDDVYMSLFLKSLFRFLGYPDNRDEWSTCVLVQLCDEFPEEMKWLDKDTPKSTRLPTK